MKLNITKEMIVAYEIVGVLLIIIGISYHGSFVLLYLMDYFLYISSKSPDSLIGPHTKPEFPNLPSVWLVIPPIVMGILFIWFGRMMKKTLGEDK